MTRARFLSLVASLPIAAQTTNSTQSSSLKSGQLLITAGNPDEDAILMAESDLLSSQQLVKGKGLASALAPDNSALYSVYYHLLDNQPLLTLTITQFASPRWAYGTNYPRSLQTMRRWNLAISPDGRQLYTFLDNSAYIFDTLSGNFLPKLAIGLEGGNFIARNSREFDQYRPEDHTIRRYTLGKDGAIASTSEFPSPAGPVAKPSELQRCSAGPVSYFIHSDGHVLIASDVYNVARVDPSPQGSEMQLPTVTGDRKLLFVPTGPSPYIDRIAVYETSKFSRVGELHSQRRLSSITANLDGSRLYATLGDSSIVILDATSLAEKKSMRYPYPTIRAISVVP
jgi:hypothetical protein